MDKSKLLRGWPVAESLLLSLCLYKRKHISHALHHQNTQTKGMDDGVAPGVLNCMVEEERRNLMLKEPTFVFQTDLANFNHSVRALTVPQYI